MPHDMDISSLNTKLAGLKRGRSNDDDENDMNEYENEDDHHQSYDDSISSPNTILLDTGSPTPKCTPRKPKSTITTTTTTTTTPRKRTKKILPQQHMSMMPLETSMVSSLYESTSDTSSSSCDYSNNTIASHSFPQSTVPSHITMDMMYHSFNPDPYNNYTDVDEAVATSWLEELAPHHLAPFDE